MITANIFEIFGSGLLLTQKEQCVSGSAAVCVTSLPWLISCRVICENAGQVLTALSFGGDDWALLNPSPVASSPGFAGLAPLLPVLPQKSGTHSDPAHCSARSSLVPGRKDALKCPAEQIRLMSPARQEPLEAFLELMETCR